ncbi:MAG: hypothetical protein H6Q22_1292, partial [Bacteroidetes bacterium]|nr:hypothetical protein [Bacteroidota bacterium]
MVNISDKISFEDIIRVVIENEGV